MQRTHQGFVRARDSVSARLSRLLNRERPRGGRSRRSLTLRAALLLALAGGVAMLLARIVPGSGKRLANAGAGWLAAEVLLELAACAGYAWLFDSVFFDRTTPKHLLRSAQIGVGELGAFAVMPSGVGAPILRLWALRRGGMPLRTALVRSVAHIPIFNAPYVLAAAGLGVAAALGAGPGRAPLVVALAPLGIVLLATALGGAITVHFTRRRPEPGPGWKSTILQAIATVPEGLREIPRCLHRPGSLLGAVGYWAGDLGVFTVAFHSAGGSAPVAVIALAYMLGQLGNALPLPGGVGGVEPLMLGVLIASGVDPGLGAAAVILYRLVSLGTQGIGGSIAVATLIPALAPAVSARPPEPHRQFHERRSSGI